MHRGRWHLAARHDEEPAHRAGRGAREVRRRARAGGRRAGADGRQHRQRAGRGRHRPQDRRRADQQVRLAGRAAGGGGRGRVQGQARRVAIDEAREAVACRASWCACARTCRCRSRSPSCTASSPTRSSCASCSASSSSRASSTSCRRPGAAAIAPHAEGDARARRHGRPRGGRAGRAAAPRPRDREARRSWRRWPPRSARRGRSVWRRSTTARRPCAPTSSGIAFALPASAARYLPLDHRYLGAPACIPEAEALAVLGAAARRARRRQARPRREDAGGAAAAPGPDAGRRRVGPDAGGVPAGRLAHPLRPGRRQLGARASRRSPAAAAGWAAARPRRPRREISVEEVGARLGAEAAGVARAGRAAAGEAGGNGGLDGLYRDIELPLAHVLARIECRGIQLDIDQLRELGQEVGTLLAALETEIHAPRGHAVQHRLAEAARRGPVRQAGAAGRSARPRPAPRPTPTRWRSWPRCTRCPAKIVDYRVLSKLKGTYIDALPALVNPRDRAGCTRRSTRRSPRPAACPPATRTCRTSPSAARSGGASARRSSPIPGTCSSRPTTRRSSCGSSRTSRRIRRSWTPSARATTSTSAPPPRCSASPPGRRHRRAAAHRQGDQLRPGRSARATSAWRRCCASRARQARTYIESYFERYAGVRAYMERSIAEARATARGGRRCWAAAARCRRSARRARRTAPTPSASRATRRSRARRPTS